MATNKQRNDRKSDIVWAGIAGNFLVLIVGAILSPLYSLLKPVLIAVGLRITVMTRLHAADCTASGEKQNAYT